MSRKQEKEHPSGAILQRDKRTYAIVPRTPVGILTPDILERIARVARDHDVPLIKITSGQRIALVGIERDEVEPIWQELGTDIGRASELCVHYVQACPGTTWCKYGKRDSIGLGLRLEEMFAGEETPAKVKIGVSGCALNCAESYMRDIGLFAKSSGWTVIFGGTAASKPRVGDVIASDLEEEAAVELVKRLLETYRAGAKRKERTARFVRRVGIESIKVAVGPLD